MSLFFPLCQLCPTPHLHRNLKTLFIFFFCWCTNWLVILHVIAWVFLWATSCYNRLLTSGCDAVCHKRKHVHFVICHFNWLPANSTVLRSKQGRVFSLLHLSHISMILWTEWMIAVQYITVYHPCIWDHYQEQCKQKDTYKQWDVYLFDI